MQVNYITIGGSPVKCAVQADRAVFLSGNTNVADQQISSYFLFRIPVSLVSDGTGKPAFWIAREYIEENYRNPDLTLQSICNDLAISMSYFSIIFKRYTGETFIEALTKKRMQQSMELLKNTSMKIYEIAEKVGFGDPHYFAVTFKKYTGMTPKEYAKEGRHDT